MLVYRLQRLSPFGNFLENIGGPGGPDQRLGLCIVVLQVGFDCVDVAEDTAADGVVVDYAEESFDEIDPGGRCRGEVEVMAGGV